MLKYETRSPIISKIEKRGKLSSPPRKCREWME
jgi:hypothetical protein